MKRSKWIALAGAALAVSLATAGTAAGASQHRGGGSYTVTPLVSDQAAIGANPADPKLINAWGISAGPTTPWWVSNQGTQTTTLYDGTGAKQPLVVAVPGAGPTGTVFYGGTGFPVANSATTTEPAKFMFATLNGTIEGWPAPLLSTVTGFDGSKWHASYTGLTISGEWLYAADFANGRVDVIDNTWQQVKLPGAFRDWRLPKGYSPFGVQAAGGYIFVQYAKVDPKTHRNQAGKGLGIVDEYTTDGKLVARVGTGGKLNAPWGVAWAPATGFGKASGALLVGNFGDGLINTFRQDHKGRWKWSGRLLMKNKQPVWIDGLWGIGFGNGNKSGPVNSLYFAAGPAGETHGLFGVVTADTP
jgi:uncharacterized protein (TIGR03118 family)